MKHGEEETIIEQPVTPSKVRNGFTNMLLGGITAGMFAVIAAGSAHDTVPRQTR